MAAGLITIKRRIQSITNTRKITKAMGLIATSTLRKARRNLDANLSYYSSFEDVMKKVSSGILGENIYTNGNGSKEKLYITMTSDAGLCGGFNGNVVNAAVSEISKDRENSLIMSVGQKGRGYFKRLQYDTIAEYVDIQNEPTLTEAKTISEHALSLYNKGEIGEINIVYSKFISTIKQDIIIKRVLPFDMKDIKYDGSIEFEPEINELIEGIVAVYLKSQLFNFLLNSKASEQASKMTAMDSATKNANELLDDLNLRYNRIRQSAITQEITEIVSGAEAQK
uniref:ATP synthase gamma chain n=1 Tax=Clostridium pasteurianum TaxID=1501 RepID=ATPG_CLOPA|nr:RecName: Full=ATP synthase gamma chain; AltName: Full=ATP synthase F1 sector gamma subunit; AltName: Full=F-ATPase gamma subunit [Clostridium pasteurianum]AAK72442.1 ATP synthase gamma subunit [Clostridium pasteurianum]